MSAKFVLKLLTDEQKKNGVSICTELKNRADPEFLTKTITQEENWLYGYDPETKIQSAQ